MNCPEAELLLETFHDGELGGRLMRDTAIHLAGCAPCAALLAEHEHLRSLVADSVEADMAGVDEGQVWAGVSAALASSAAEQSAWRGFRLAAASAKVRGVLVGGPAPAASDQDTWLAPASSGRTASPSAFFGGGLALAASLLLGFFLVGEEEAARTPGVGSGQFAEVSAAAEPVRSARVLGARQVVAAAFPAVRASSPHHQQVQIHSLNDFGGEMAMWAEPAGDTAVIWLGETAPRARR